MRDPTHLGDGAYAGHDGYQILLAANHHNNVVIALESQCLVALMMYVNQKFPHIAKEMADIVQEPINLSG